MSGFDATLDAAIRPLADLVAGVVFYSPTLFGRELPLIVVWLVAAAVWCTFLLRFVSLRGFGHALALVSGRHTSGRARGEVSHFQALTTAVSGTVGIGNIGGVAVAISLGGPGAAFWLVVAGFLGMSSKFLECTLGVKYRRIHADGRVSGGPMYYLERGLGERGWPRVGRALGLFYAVGMVVGCLGIGNMFQANQAHTQLVGVSGGDASLLATRGWLFGLVLASVVSAVTVGGLRAIARVTERLVPFMAGFYLLGAVVLLALNRAALPDALAAIVRGAFTPDGVAGGALGVMVIGFQRAVFSNEAGLGSATIAHSAVRTDEPLTEGFVALLEPFVDTLVICTATALVVVTTSELAPGFAEGLDGIAITSAAFERRAAWAPVPLAAAAVLFAVSTMLAWSYYGLKGWTYLVGEHRAGELVFHALFAAFVVVGSSIELEAVLALSDAFVFLLCVPNVVGLYLLGPAVRRELDAYWARRARRARRA